MATLLLRVSQSVDSNYNKLQLLRGNPDFSCCSSLHFTCRQTIHIKYHRSREREKKRNDPVKCTEKMKEYTLTRTATVQTIPWVLEKEKE